MDVFDLYAKLSLDSKDYDRSLQNASSEADQWATKFAMVAKSAGSAFMSMGRSIGNVVNQSVEAYGEYEQLVGGAQKIFDEMDYSVIAKDAQSAFESMNLSASQYLSMMNSVGATFAQTMGDEKGYLTAKVGMQAIADYSSGTGRSVEELNQKFALITRSTSSYQSIADQFAGILPATSKDFLDQAKAAGYLSGKYTDLTKVPIAEYQEAVAKMLEKGVKDMGLAGNTAAETAYTLTGSLAGMKSSWENVLATMVGGGEDFDKAIKNFAKASTDYINNLIPAIGGAMNGFSALVEELAPVISAKLPELVQDLLPGVVSAAQNILSGLMGAMPGLLTALKDVAPLVSDALVNLVPDLVSFILEGIPLVVDAGLTLLTSLVSGFANNVQTIVPDLTQGVIDMVDQLIDIIGGGGVDLANAGLTLLSGLAKALVEAVPSVLTQLTQLVQDLTESIGSAAESTDAQMFTITAKAILTNLVEKLSETVPTLIPELTSAVVELITQFADIASSGAVDFANAGITLLKTLVESISGSIPQVMTDITTAVMTIIGAIVDAFTGLDINSLLSAAETIVSALTDGIVQSVGVITEKLPEIIGTITGWIENPENLSGIVDSAVNIINTLANGLVASVNKIVDVLPDIIMEILGWFTNPGNLTTLADGAVSIIDNLATGLTSAITNLTDKLPELITGIVDWLIDPAHLTEMATAALDIFGVVVSNVPQIIESLVVGLHEIILGIAKYFTDNGGEIVDGFKAGFNAVTEKASEIWEEKIKPAFETMGTNIKDYFLQFEWVQTVKSWLENFVTTIKTEWKNVTTTISQKIDEIKTTFAELPQNALQWGKDLIDNFINGLKSKAKELLDAIVSIIPGPIRDFIGFSEPKKGPLSNFHTYAPDMMELFASGIRDNEAMLHDTVASAFDFSNIMSKAIVPTDGALSSVGGANLGGMVFNVYGAEGMDEQMLARLVADQVRDQVVSIGAIA